MAHPLIKVSVERLALFFVRHPRWLILSVFVYILSPIDLLPEGLLGPLGFIDDLFVLMIPFLIRGYAEKITGGSPRPRDYVDTTGR